MFSIGLFSTYLPYILLAMFYGLYLGVHSIIKIELGSDIDDKELAAKTIFKDNNGSKQGAAGKTCYYVQFAEEHKSAFNNRIRRIVDGSILLTPHEDPVRLAYYHPLFSRPPPPASL